MSKQDDLISSDENRMNNIAIHETGERTDKLYDFFDFCVDVAAAALSLFSITYAFGRYNILSGYSRHLIMALFICFLGKGVINAKKHSRWRPVFFLLLTAALTATCIYLDVNSLALSRERLGMYNTWDYIAGAVLIVSCIIAAYVTYGASLTCIVAVFGVYLFWGQSLPAFIRHPPLSLKRIISILGLYQEGIMGTALGAIVQTVGAVLVFAGFLEVSGASKVFMDLTIATFGRYTGGAAKISIVSSSLFGTISGSAAANVAGTGVITIPLMKKTGIEAHFAGAVEAAASSGGQIMPPVMGAAAFIMAEMRGVPYPTVLVAALIPALLFYATRFMSVDLYAHKRKIRGISNEMDMPSARNVLAHGGYLLLPVILLFGLVAVFNRSAQYSALISTLAIIVLSWFRKESRITPQKFWKALVFSGRQIVPISVVCAAAGLVIGIFNATGLGIKLSTYIVSMAGNSLFVLCVLAAISSLILGMGMPTVACYLLLVALVVPAMIDFGVPPIAAHMFVFYFGIISAITPPVAIAAYVASGICGSSPMKVGLTSCEIALPVFLVPFVFVFQPALLMQGSIGEISQVCLTSLLGCFACSAGVQGYLLTKMGMAERTLCLASALLVLIPETFTDLLGIICLIFVLIINFSQKKKATTTT